MRVILFILLMGLMLSVEGQISLSDSIKKPEREWKIDTSIEQHATYINGDAALFRFLMKSVQFPEDENSECFAHSRIIMAAMIDELGNVEQVKLIRSICPDIDKQFVHVIKDLKFKPAIKKGLPVRDVLHIPIQICLR